MNSPATRAGRWLLDRTRWDDGMRGFFVRINATAGPDDMHRHILAIESEARAIDAEKMAAAMRDLFPANQIDRWPFSVEEAVAALLAAAYAVTHD